MDSSCTNKSTGELLLDLQEGSSQYFDRMERKKCFYVLFDTVWLPYSLKG